jgi:hypothetical protein
LAIHLSFLIGQCFSLFRQPNLQLSKIRQTTDLYGFLRLLARKQAGLGRAARRASSLQSRYSPAGDRNAVRIPSTKARLKGHFNMRKRTH